MSLIKLILAVALYFLVLPIVGLAEELPTDCEGKIAEVPVRTDQASANVLSNVVRSQGSLRQVLEDVLAGAETEVNRAQAPSDLCPNGCRAVRDPGYVMTTVPKDYLQGNDKEAYCAERKAKTVVNPIRVDKDFSSIAEFSEWFNNYSRGKGEEGEQLYAQCDANCSPEYRSDITQTPKGFHAKVQVVCGHARDKWDNSYKISLLARWSCAPVENISRAKLTNPDRQS